MVKQHQASVMYELSRFYTCMLLVLLSFLCIHHHFSRHYPTWSIAKHGPSKCLVEKLPKLMEKFQVSAYISGHDHNLQLIKKNGLLFATSGAGAYVDKSTRNMDKVGRDNVKRVAELQGRSLEKKSYA